MIKKKICFVNLASPDFLGGISLYQKNLIKNISLDKFEITWVYKSTKEERHSKDGINYVGLKTKKVFFIDDFLFNNKVGKYLRDNYFDIINSNATSGYWLKNYKKKKGQKIIHTYHGSAIPYFKIWLGKFNFLKRILISSFLLPLGYLIDKPPMQKADKIICVSEKVKNEIERNYFKRENIFVVRTGVDVSRFKPLNRKEVRKKINLNPNFIYGMYVGKGGYWIKGLDRAMKLSEEIYKINKNFRLIVIGSDYEKVKNLINKKFVIYIKELDRNRIPLYYSSSDLFLCLSRYEGGAPTLVVSEAMASGCLLVCSRDSKQEILKDNDNCVEIDKFNYKSAKKIIYVLSNEKIKKRLTQDSIKKIKELSLKEWSKRMIKVLLN